MPVVRKTFGEYPMTTVVNTTEVSFDHEGIAEVEQDIFEALMTVPGFEEHVVDGSEPEEVDETDEEQSSEDETTEQADAPAPTKPSRKRPGLKK